MDAVQPRSSKKPGLVGVLEKNFQNHISGFVADFAVFAHITETEEATRV